MEDKIKTLEGTINHYPGDHLIYIGRIVGVDIRKFTLIKGLIAQQMEHMMNDHRSKDAVKAAIAFGNGEIERAELDASSEGARKAWLSVLEPIDWDTFITNKNIRDHLRASEYALNASDVSAIHYLWDTFVEP